MQKSNRVEAIEEDPPASAPPVIRSRPLEELVVRVLPPKVADVRPHPAQVELRRQPYGLD